MARFEQVSKHGRGDRDQDHVQHEGCEPLEETGPREREQTVRHRDVLRGRLWRGSLSVRHLAVRDRKSTRLNSSHQIISYAVFCLKKKNKIQTIRLSLEILTTSAS